MVTVGVRKSFRAKFNLYEGLYGDSEAGNLNFKEINDFHL